MFHVIIYNFTLCCLPASSVSTSTDFDLDDREDLAELDFGDEVVDLTFFRFCFLGLLGRLVGGKLLNIADDDCRPKLFSKSANCQQLGISYC